MNFLSPLFLLGGAALALPILYHLIRRTTRERRAFSSLLFLQPSPPRISKRHRLEHLLLLFLRCLALLLLALGFSRPFFRETSPGLLGGTRPKRTVLLVDVSASMQRDGLWAAARERTELLLKQAAPGDHLALYVFDRTARPLVSFEEWDRAGPGDRVAVATNRLGTAKPGGGGTHLGNALISAAEALAEGAARAIDEERQIIVVSDLQAGSRLDALQAYEWPKSIALVIESLAPRQKTNAGVQVIADAADVAGAAGNLASVRVRVTNSSDAQREQFQVGWSESTGEGRFLGAPISVYVPPGQSRVVALPVPKEGPRANRVLLRGDDEPFDNLAYVIPPTQQRIDVLWIGNDDPANSRERLFFLNRALTETPRTAPRTTTRRPDAPSLSVDVQAARLIFVADSVPANVAEALRAQVEVGKVVVFLPRTAAAAPTLAALTGRPTVQMANAQPASYAMLAEIDFQHPLLAPFADPRYSDFTKIHFWKYRKIDAAEFPGARFLAKFDNGDPALFEVTLGRGRLLVLTSGWQPDDSQLAVSTKFVPLLWSLLEASGEAGGASAQFVVGESITLPAELGEKRQLRGPDGTEMAVPAGAKTIPAPGLPGLYELSGGARSFRFAVNLDPNESRTAPLAADELERMGLPVAQKPVPGARPPAEKAALLQAAEAEGRQKLWRWFVTATLTVILIESALAGWTARRRTTETTPEVAA